MQVAGHDQPIRVVRCFEANGTPMIATGSWDKTVKYWDCRQSSPAATLQCQERVYTMDVRNNLLVVGTADRYINVVNLASPDKFYKTLQSPLKWQTRVVSCFADAAGFAIGSIEGRCAIQYVEDKDSGYVRCVHVFFVSSRSHAYMLTTKQLQFLLQVPPRPTSGKRHQRLRRQRHLLPPSPWHLLDGWLRWDVPLLGQRRQAQTQGLPQRRRQHHGYQLQQERQHLRLRHKLRLVQGLPGQHTDPAHQDHAAPRAAG